ncbi:MAG: TadE/TadG family type IV pilus assembly protein [Bryobacteraceae bacterium]
MRKRSHPSRGNSMLEFLLVGIPILFILISTFEMGFGMWIYHGVGNAVREGTRYVIVHGSDCATPNSCQVTVAQIAAKIQAGAPGLDPSQFTLTLTPASGGATSGTLSTLLTNSAIWPPSSANTPGLTVTISGTYPFQSIFTMLWTGVGRAQASTALFTLGASSSDRMVF